MSLQTEILTIGGMSCSHCVSSITKVLSETDGVQVESVEIGTAKITYDTDKAPREKLVEAIEDIGFDVQN